MPAFRMFGMSSGINSRGIMPGDTILKADSLATGALATVGAGQWTAAGVTSQFIRRTGPVGAYADTTPTAAQIIAALAGNMPAGSLIPGNSFDTRFINTVAQAMTLTLGTGIVAGVGTLNCAASLWRDYVWTILNTTPEQLISCATTNGSPTVTFVFPPGQTSYPMGMAANAINITPGATVSGTGITAGTTVLGITQGQGGITGVTLSANATATTNPVGLTFGPTLQLDSTGSGTL